MRAVYEERVAEQTEINRQLSAATDKIVGPWLFTEFAKKCWPENTAAELAAIARKSERGKPYNVRTAERWLAGEFEPPICVVFAIINKMFERRGQ